MDNIRIARKRGRSTPKMAYLANLKSPLAPAHFSNLESRRGPSHGSAHLQNRQKSFPCHSDHPKS